MTRFYYFLNYFIFLLLIVYDLFFLTVAHAFEPSYTSNKFGIHLAQAQSEDIVRAAELVNSNGGKWGYVTLVIQENDRDLNKWQAVFDQLRELKLIPLIRLATSPQPGGYWRRPEPEDIDGWIKFLNLLHWVVKDRYIILFNEPNHATEWGAEVDVKSYANIAKRFAAKLKASNSDYVVMLAGFDVSAPQSAPNYADAYLMIQEVVKTIGVSDFNKLFDAWSSHSYPNPGFAGSPFASGRGTIRSYEWELNLLASLGVKPLPVFITETGWSAKEVPRSQIAYYWRIAYEQVWLPDRRVMAVTPFILNYQGEPFWQFSWIQPNNTGVFPEYELVKSLPKVAGKPPIIDQGEVVFNLPKELVAESSYRFYFYLKNQGQAIWESDDGYTIAIEGLDQANYITSFINQVLPHQTREQDFFFRTGTEPGYISARIVLKKEDKAIASSTDWQFEILPLPSLILQLRLFPKVESSGDDFELQIFDKDENLVYKDQVIKVVKGEGEIKNVKNIVLGEPYRLVVLKKHYLPVQRHLTFEKGKNIVAFQQLLPVDFDANGNFSFADLSYLIFHPQMLSLLFP